MRAQIEKDFNKKTSGNRCEKRVPWAWALGGSAVCGGHPLKTYHLFSSLLSSRISSRLGAFSRLGMSCYVSRSRLSYQGFIFVNFVASADAF